MQKGVSTVPLSFNRRMVIASASVTRKKNAIHSFTEVDVTIPRKLIQSLFEQTGEKLSFTAYIVKCLAQTVKQYPQFNSFIKGSKLVMLDDITISVMTEREFEGEKVPEPLGIQQAQLKTYRQLSDEIRSAQKNTGKKLGSLNNQTWIRFIPGFLMKTFIKLADRNITMAKRYGKVAVTAVGMFTNEPIWFIPHGTATVMLTVGSIVKKTVCIDDKKQEREFLCLTASFDHDIVDGAPAARFMNQLIETIRSGYFIK
ncbi:MAG TPA: 2-oxo acid dehydrogenase subunit E2 [Draconibacterium sp.]|nr:2-oxo acid dehydrogenase subunit E2 [Draconibacterium sp.]